MVKSRFKSPHEAIVTRGDPAFRLHDIIVIIIAVALTVAAFANTAHGEFVYDDPIQIVDNPLIQQDQLFWTALTSDVWAFKGEKEEPWSNYWRPFFVLWLILNVRLFGIENPVGWHCMNILLHALVVILAYGLLRQLRVARPIGAAIVFLFAIHPVQVESVAWISGSPNMLSAATMLGALWCGLAAHTRPHPVKWSAALFLYALSIMSKETVTFFPILLFIAVFSLNRMKATSLRRRIVSSAKAALPFALVVALYYVARLLVLGQLAVTTHERESPASVLATLPSVIVFYIRQIVYPYWIGPSYSLRPIILDDIGWINFVVPLLLISITAIMLVVAADRHPVRQIGLAFLVLTFAPALNIRAFYLEHIVQDRYLYIPLLGTLMVLVPALASLIQKLTPISKARIQWVCLAMAAFACIPLMAQTVRYNRAWTSELALWEWAIQTDPKGVISQTKYGYALRKAGRRSEAKAAFERAVAIRPQGSAMVSLAIMAMEEGRFDEAEHRLKQVIQREPDIAAAYDQLTVCYQRQGRFDEAAAVIRQARDNIPHLKHRFTANLAVILYQANKRNEALAELEAIRDIVEQEYWSDAHRVLFLLGTLYDEMGRLAEAKAALKKYLQITDGHRDTATLDQRAKAKQALARISE